jgi:putative ABC transport system permease protein
MNRMLFYLQYAFRNLWRSRRWSAFAMLSVAAGVATVVALRSLGLAIDDSLTSNLQASNHGDITIDRGETGPALGGREDWDIFSEQQMQPVREWVENNNAQMTEYTDTMLQVSAAGSSNVGLLNFMRVVLIDPVTYPPTQDIVALDPKGVPLGQLFQGGNEIVISDNLASSQQIKVGDEVRISGTTETFIVRGIVPTQSEAGLRDIISAFFGFAYLDRTEVSELLSVPPQPNTISILLPDGTSYDEIDSAANDLRRILNRNNSGFIAITTVPELLEENEVIADITGRFIVVMGLGAMLIGGVGIINTMLVMVRRRTNEIAALKTFGLKGRQVASVFMTEALLLGVFGSILGATVGSILSKFTYAYGETFIKQPLVWKLYPEALVFGITLGVVVTAVFGVMPVLTAIKVRPAAILRPNETHMPALGVLQSLGTLLFVVLALGLIAGQVIGELPEELNIDWSPIPSHSTIGIILVAVTLVILGIFVCILWIIVWIVSKLPAFGIIDLRLALRNLGTHRVRTATTLLAISIGMFAISSITFYGAGMRELLQFALTESFGGNIMIISPAMISDDYGIAQNAQSQLDNKLDEIDGVMYRTRLLNYDGRIVQIDDYSLRDQGAGIDREALQDEMEQAGREQDFERMHEIAMQLATLDTHITITIRDSDNPDLGRGDIDDGRNIIAEDRGERVAVMMQSPEMSDWQLEVGSFIILEIEGQEYEFELVGLSSSNGFGPPEMMGDISIPPDTLDGLRPDSQMNTVMADPDKINDVMLEISSMPLFFPLNIEFIDGVIGRFIDQFSALPILVGILSLGAAAVIMANTVALATLERRKQIGVFKAIGLKSRRVLGIMLLENVMISLLGGVLGIGLSALGVVVMTELGMGDAVLIPRDARPVAIGLVVAAVFIGAMATLLSANTAVRERVLNVLRYD